jgi:hypothetical protein
MAMAQTTQFWWNWAVSLLSAFGTIGAVVVALFGDRLRPSPRLHLARSTAASEGKKVDTTLTERQGDQPRQTQSRWYHVRVENQRRLYRTANEVRVYMLELQERNEAGAWETKWAGELPIKWQDEHTKPPSVSAAHVAFERMKTLGPCDV